MKVIDSKSRDWHRNLRVLWFGTFISEGAISIIVPIMPLFLKTLGQYSNGQINLLTGAAFSITFLVKAIASPWWGKISDRSGHKVMLLRASGGLAFCCFLISVAPNVGVILVARTIQGFFSGYVNNSESIIAAAAPRQQSGAALGTLATGDTAGLLCGPIAGGVLATFFGFRVTFLIASLLLLIVFGLSWYFVQENFKPLKKTEKVAGIKQTILEQMNPHNLLLAFFITMLIQATNNAVNPMLSLYLSTMLHNNSSLALISGIISALPGIATVISAAALGHLGDEWGQKKVLLYAFSLGMLTYLIQGFATHIWLFAGLRFLTGFSIAALLPAVQSLLTRETKPQALGRIFSYNQTFQALGNVLGVMFGSIVAAKLGYHSMFLLIVLLESAGLLFSIFIQKTPTRADIKLSKSNIK